VFLCTAFAISTVFALSLANNKFSLTGSVVFDTGNSQPTHS